MKSWFEDIKREVVERLDNQYQIFSSAEVCSKFGVDAKTLRSWNKKGFPHSKINGRPYYTWTDIKNFLERNKVD